MADSTAFVYFKVEVPLAILANAKTFMADFATGRPPRPIRTLFNKSAALYEIVVDGKADGAEDVPECLKDMGCEVKQFDPDADAE